MKNKILKFTPGEATRAARKLGWTVEPKRRTGDLVFTSPSGERYSSRAAGRADRVPLVLAKAIMEAMEK